MSKYEIRQQTIYTGETKLVIVNTEIGMYAYFCGYDFMGSAEWKSDLMEAYYMDREEAEQIVKDLEAADETDEPETKTMKAIITSYKPGDYDNTRKEIMTKDILEYTQWILRAGKRGYTAIQDQTTGTLYLIQPDETCRNAFEVKFEF